MGVKIQTIKDIRFYLAKELTGIYKEPEMRILADILIKTVTGTTKLHQLYDNGYMITEREAEKIIGIIEELKTGRPIQYILGETSFYNCTIKVNSSTLIPRPETEELVDLIIRENRDYKGNIIDFGSGSGCIAVALAANLPSATLTGIEISDDAIRIANENAVLNKVKVSFIKGDILTLAHEVVSKAGIIVSNPPYVRNSEKPLMAKNVLDFEPHLALFVTDTDPLIYYYAILKLAVKILLPGGRLYFEINEAMGRPLIKLFELFYYSEIKIVSDINNKERIIKGRKNG
ncbi:MAG: peptide chain release factor N(5)-glutamine methyltransferase [Bacteroidales bacterium]|jgi:release factor glutamine methyltransferase